MSGRNSFSAAYVSAVRIAVENWDAAAVENGSNVHFSFHGLSHETKTARGDLTVIRGDVYDKKIRHLALLEAPAKGNLASIFSWSATAGLALCTKPASSSALEAVWS